ncbi:Z1 domain-containing protein [uncultured Fluviicola sp.]|uniref:Z1 domain-containing protein n=1 Tax=uncultured Fluviicola sp. TaxID=463303 RepID=UPI0025ED4905|nr:Z1 domain-containing protein [uncultured Fluviicola sp.]
MSDQKVLEQAQKICRNLLDLDPPETVEKINDVIKKVCQLLSLSNEDKELLFSRLVEVTGVSQEAPRILDNDKIEPWVTEKWSQNASSRRFWRRYQTYLEDDKKIAPKVISRLDELTDNILDRLADPDAHDEFDKRGLVVGHVQSGKTSNYVGLITKAADAGYKLIIVLAGIHSSLRSQTQLRIDEGFLGYDTETSRSFIQSNNRIGVGRLDPTVPAHSLTSSALNGDFRKNVAETINLNLRGTDPVIVVVKKNNAVLKNLIQWLSAKVGEDVSGTDHKIINHLPMLLIDDEADNASINISKSSVSSINGSIRALLCLFRKSAYVGYTATPYANVFIPLPKDEKEPGKGLKIIVGNKDYPVGEDLFPRDFIVNIPPPSNYIGPEKFFGIVSEDQQYESASDEEDEIVKNSLPIHLYEPIHDNQPKDYYDSEVSRESIRGTNFNYIPDGHKKDDAKPQELPDSLKEAIQYFILSCAARRARGQVNVHNSMLVHITRFIDWQNHIALKIEEELFRYKNRIEFRNREFLEELKTLWEREFIPKTQEIISLPGFGDSGMTLINWTELEQELLPAVTKIRVRAVHGSKLLGGLEQENIQPLDYYENQKKGLSVIAVGGNKLSRGLTLEGLTVSYYLRASKMYDTLMQMGRWFGYRPGYLDLCRLFTTGDLVSNYKHITAATEEMRAEFDRMWLLKKKPRDYGLKVRAHTGVLTITASNKFRYKKMMSFGFSGNLEETWQFDKTRKDFFEQNHLITQQLIKKLGTPDGVANESKHLKKQSLVWRGQNNFRNVIEYLTAYQSSQPSFHTGLLREYIEKQALNNKLINWTIALIRNSSANDENQVIFGDQKIGLSFRKDDSEKTSSYYELTKAHIIGNFHEYIDLNDDQLSKAFDETIKDKIESGKETSTEHPSPLRIRKNRNEANALLLIYPLNPKPRTEDSAYSDVPIIGLAISFPYMENEEKVLYAVNEVFQEQLYDYPEEMDMDDIDPDEDDLEKSNSNRKSSLSEKTFRSLIENSYQNVLKETDFHSGLVPYYPGNDELSEVLKSHTNVILTTEKASGLTSVPFYAEKEIQQFYLNDPTSVIVKTEQDFTENEHYIVGLKRSKYVTFCYHDQPAAFPDSCWVIRSESSKARFLSALFNSTLFGAWVRVNGEQKKDTYFIKNEVLYKFPLVYPEENQLWLYDHLYELMVAAGRNEQALGTGTIRSYFAAMLDALIFCTYFSESMQQEKQSLYESFESIIPKDLPIKEKRAALAEELFKVLYDRDHSVRKTIYYLDSHEKVKSIKAVFTQ